MPHEEFDVSLCRLAYAALAVALVAMASSGCDKQFQSAAAPQLPPALVVVDKAQTRDVPVYLDEIGKCSAREFVTVIPQVAGKIVERLFEDGADLTKGQPLFTIDTRPFQAALDQAKANFQQSKAGSQFAKIELERYQKVGDTRAVSKSDLDTKRNAVELGDAQVNAAQAAVEMAQLNLDYCHIRSPIDGRAGQRLMDVGNVVKANEGALLVIQRLDPIYADFTITEKQLPSVKQFMSQGTLKALVRLPSDAADAARDGELTFLDNAVQDGMGTVKLRATLPNKDRHFWPGEFVNVRLVLTMKKDAILVPSAAVQVGQQGQYVYVVGDDSTAELRPVVTGQRQGDAVVIENGVKPGERVITLGGMMVFPGGKVQVAQAPGTQPAATQQGAK